jgi:hypothetical protein
VGSQVIPSEITHSTSPVEMDKMGEGRGKGLVIFRSRISSYLRPLVNPDLANAQGRI